MGNEVEHPVCLAWEVRAMRTKVKSIQINIDDCIFVSVETERFKERRRPFARTCFDDAHSHTSDEHSGDSSFIFKHSLQTTQGKQQTIVEHRSY